MIETLALHKLWLNDHSSQKICQHLSKMVFLYNSDRTKYALIDIIVMISKDLCRSTCGLLLFTVFNLSSTMSDSSSRSCVCTAVEHCTVLLCICMCVIVCHLL